MGPSRCFALDQLRRVTLGVQKTLAVGTLHGVRDGPSRVDWQAALTVVAILGHDLAGSLAEACPAERVRFRLPNIATHQKSPAFTQV